MHFCENEPKVRCRINTFYSANEQRDRWLVSYTDVLTILLTLFVAIAAQNLSQHFALSSPNPAPATDPPRQHPTLLQVEQRLEHHNLDLRLEKRGLIISLPQTILFPSGDDHVTPTAFPMISEIAATLRDIPNKVALVGHADSLPIHNNRFENNWELSAARSLSLLALLTSEYGVPESRLLVESEGATDPKSSNATEAGRAENRRVEILILDDL